MPLDLSQFHPVFFEETAEHLATMEALLLHLDPQAPDDEQLDDLVRAAHSIKGSGGTFGFRDMADLAEALELLLANVRKGRQPLTAALHGALREACAALRHLLAGYRGEGGAAVGTAKPMAARLRGLLADRAGRQQGPTPFAARGAKVSPAGTAPGPVAAAAELRELARRTAAAHDEVMALLEAAGAGGLREVSEAVRALGEALEQNAALAQHALDNAEALREAFHVLVRDIAGLALSRQGGRAAGRPRPLPKVCRASGTAGSGKDWPEF